MSPPSEFFNRQPPFYSPLCLSDNVLVGRSAVVTAAETLAPGAPTAAEGVKIRNPNKTAMLVDQFQFTFNPQQSSNLRFVAQFSTNLMLGSIALTNGFVPMFALCPTYIGVRSRTDLARNATFAWHLPRPLYVPPNVAISAQFMQQTLAPAIPGETLTGPFTFSTRGRSLPKDFPVPPEIFVPWATHYRNTDRSVSTFTTDDKSLINPYPQPMRITRFLGWVPWIALNATSTAITGNPQSSQRNLVTVRMTLSNGKMLVSTDTPFYHVFSPSRRTMDVDAILQANEFVKAIVNVPDGFTDDDDNPTNVNAQLLDATIGMIGYRVLKTPRGSWT